MSEGALDAAALALECCSLQRSSRLCVGVNEMEGIFWGAGFHGEVYTFFTAWNLFA